METSKFELYAPVRNTINKSLGVVVKAAGENITIQLKNGDRMTFKAQYLEPAPETDAAALKELIELIKKKDEEHSKPNLRIVDPELIRADLEKYIKHIAVVYPQSGEAFRTFWAEITAAIGDLPGKTWEMKPVSSKNPCPVVKVYNHATQNWVYCLNLLAGWGLRMEIKKEFLPAEFTSLFPIDNAMFGAGRAVEIIYKDFTPEKRAPYAACLRAIYKASNPPA